MGYGVVRGPDLAGQPPLPSVRMQGNAGSRCNVLASLLLRWVLRDVLGQNTDGPGAVQGDASAVAIRHILGNDESGGRDQHKSAQGHEG